MLKQIPVDGFLLIFLILLWPSIRFNPHSSSIKIFENGIIYIYQGGKVSTLQRQTLLEQEYIQLYPIWQPIIIQSSTQITSSMQQASIIALSKLKYSYLYPPKAVLDLSKMNGRIIQANNCQDCWRFPSKKYCQLRRTKKYPSFLYFNHIFLVFYQKMIDLYIHYCHSQTHQLFQSSSHIDQPMSELQYNNDRTRINHFNRALSQLTRTRFKQKWFKGESSPLQFEQNDDLQQKKQYKPLIRINFMNSKNSHRRNNSKNDGNNKDNEQHLSDADRLNYKQIKAERAKNESNFSERDSTFEKHKIQFNVDDLANSLASPIKLKSKINNQTYRNNMNVSRYQNYLKDIQKQKGKYHQEQTFERMQQTRTQEKYPSMNLKQNMVQYKIKLISKSMQRKHLLQNQQYNVNNGLLPWRQTQQYLSYFKIPRVKIKIAQQHYEEINQIFP